MEEDIKQEQNQPVERDVLGMEKKPTNVDFTEGYKTAKKVSWGWILFAILAIAALAIIYMMRDDQIEEVDTPANTEIQAEEGE